MCPRPPRRVTHLLLPRAPSSLLGVVIQISKGAYLPVPSNLLSSVLHSTPGSSHAGSRVPMATRGRAFAYYTLCVTSRLVMYAPCRCGGVPCRRGHVCAGLPSLRLSERQGPCVCVRASARGLERGCKGIGRRCEQRQMRNCHLRRDRGEGCEVEEREREREWRRERRNVKKGAGGGAPAIAVLCTLQGCCNLPYPTAASTSRVNSPHVGESPAAPSRPFVPPRRHP